jgi:hypothetical protein
LIVRVAGVLLLGLVVLGCKARSRGSDRGAPALHDAGTGAALQDGGTCTRPPAEVEGPYVDLCLSRAEVETFAAFLREALTRRDWARVASLVRYPLRVHTAHCLKLLTSPEALVAHHDEIFTTALVDDMFSTRPPFFVRDTSVMLASAGRAWAWVGDDRRLALGAVFLGQGDLAGVVCADREIEPIPAAVGGTWAVSSVRAGEMEQLTSFPWKDWKRFEVTIDPLARTLSGKLGAARKECKVLWLARETSPEPALPARCAAFESFWGPEARRRARILAASCPGGELIPAPELGRGVVPEFLLVDGSTMVLRLGCEGIAVLKKRSGPAPGIARRIVPPGAPCGTMDVDCAPGARCVAVSATPLVERCKSMEEAAE